MDWVRPGRAVGSNYPARLTVIKLMIGYYNFKKPYVYKVKFAHGLLSNARHSVGFDV